MSASATRYDLDPGQAASFVVGDASAGFCGFPVPVASLVGLFAGTRLRPMSVVPGQGLLGLAFLDQRAGSFGPHRQAGIVVAAAPERRRPLLAAVPDAIAAARGRIPFHVLQHPVASEEARALGGAVYGLATSLHAVDVRYEPRRVHCELVMHGRHVLTLSMPRGGAGPLPRTSLELLSQADGGLLRTRGALEGEGVTEGGRRVELLLGDHPLADRLRRLGLPKRPSRSAFVEALRARVDHPEPLGAPSR